MKTAKPFDRTQVFEMAEREATHVQLSELNRAEHWLAEQRDEAPTALVHEGSRWDLSEDAMIALCDSHEAELADPCMSDYYELIAELDAAQEEDWLDEHRYDNYRHEEEMYGDVVAPSLTFEDAMAERDEQMDRRFAEMAEIEPLDPVIAKLEELPYREARRHIEAEESFLFMEGRRHAKRNRGQKKVRTKRGTIRRAA